MLGNHESRSQQSQHDPPVRTGQEPQHDTVPEARESSSQRPTYAQDRSEDQTEPLMTTRFEHSMSEAGHSIWTGRDGEALQRCEDEPIHIPGAVQAFGMLAALELQHEKLVFRIVSENCERMIGYTPQELFALHSFADILAAEETEHLLEHLQLVRDQNEHIAVHGPELFTLSILSPTRQEQQLWCAMHISPDQPHLVICEFELKYDSENPLVQQSDSGQGSENETGPDSPLEEPAGLPRKIGKPLRSLWNRNTRSNKPGFDPMGVLNIMDELEGLFAAVSTLGRLLEVLASVIEQITGFHRIMIYQFDKAWNGQVVTERVKPEGISRRYYGLHFPASDIPQQARDLYKINKVRLLYDREQETARLVCRTREDLATPLNLTFSLLRAMSPIHAQYLANMGVRSSISISLTAFDGLWGLISCHNYGPQGHGSRVSFPARKLCRLVGDMASKNIERLFHVSVLHARKLISTDPSRHFDSGYIIASSKDLLELFNADFGLVSLGNETKSFGNVISSPDIIATAEYLRSCRFHDIVAVTNIRKEFPEFPDSLNSDLVAGFLLVPLSSMGQDFIIFFRRELVKQVSWAGNPYKGQDEDGQPHLQPRTSFESWSETVTGTCQEWAEESTEAAANLRLVYGKFIEIWRQKEAALHDDRMTRSLLANSTHEVRTPLNAIVNYIETALDSILDESTRQKLIDSHSASKTLIYMIKDMLELTTTVEQSDVIRHEPLDPRRTLKEATDLFRRAAERKRVGFEVSVQPALPNQVIGDAHGLRQAIANITSNAIKFTPKGDVSVEMLVGARTNGGVNIGVHVSDTGIGIAPEKLDALSRELQIVDPGSKSMSDISAAANRALKDTLEAKAARSVGVGLAVVRRILQNTGGQLRVQTEEEVGSRFVLSIPFSLPESISLPDSEQKELPAGPVGVDTSSANTESNSQLASSSMAEERILITSGST